MKSHEEIIRSLSPDRQKKIAARTEELKREMSDPDFALKDAIFNSTDYNGLMVSAFWHESVATDKKTQKDVAEGFETVYGEKDFERGKSRHNKIAKWCFKRAKELKGE